MTGVFEVLAADDFDERRSSRKAVAIAVKRASTRFSNFLSIASDKDDYEARIDLIEEDLWSLVTSACEDMGHGDRDSIMGTVRQQLTAAGGFCDDCRKWKSGPKAGCECGTEESGGNDDGHEYEEWGGKDSVKVATELTGLGGPSPKMDKKRWKPNALNPSGNLHPIDTDGGRYKTESQDIADSADWTSDDFLDQTDAVLDHNTDVEKTWKGETHHTDTWSGTSGFADPVTSGVGVGTQTPQPPVPGAAPAPQQAQPMMPGVNQPEQGGARARCEQCQGAGCPTCGGTGITGNHPGEGAMAPGGQQGEFQPGNGMLPSNMNLAPTRDQFGQTPNDHRWSAVDPDRNPIADLIEYEYEGFVPQDEVQQAVTAHTRRRSAPMQAVVNKDGFHNGVNEFLSWLAANQFGPVPAGSLMVDGRPYQPSQDPYFVQAMQQPGSMAGQTVTVDYPHPKILGAVKATIESGNGDAFLAKCKAMGQGAPAQGQPPAQGAPPAQAPAPMQPQASFGADGDVNAIYQSSLARALQAGHPQNVAEAIAKNVARDHREQQAMQPAVDVWGPAR